MHLHPKLVLLFACLLPGGGHLLLGRWQRALGFFFFTAFFAALTWHIAPADRSIIGRTAGGLFIWALSVPDAYKSARLRSAFSRDARV